MNGRGNRKPTPLTRGTSHGVIRRNLLIYKTPQKEWSPQPWCKQGGLGRVTELPPPFHSIFYLVIIGLIIAACLFNLLKYLACLFLTIRFNLRQPTGRDQTDGTSKITRGYRWQTGGVWVHLDCTLGSHSDWFLRKKQPKLSLSLKT